MSNKRKIKHKIKKVGKTIITNCIIKNIKRDIALEIPSILFKSIPKGIKTGYELGKKEAETEVINYLINLWEVIKSFVVAQCVLLYGPQYAANIGIDINNDSEVICKIKDGRYNNAYHDNSSDITYIFCTKVCNLCKLSERDTGIIFKRLNSVLKESGI